jgi:hypothetical protein
VAAAVALTTGVAIPLTTAVARADVGDLADATGAAAASCGTIGTAASSPGGAGGLGGVIGGDGGNGAASGIACAAAAAPGVDLSGGGDFFGDQVNIGDRSGGDTTIEGDSFNTSVDCSVRTTTNGKNQSSTGSRTTSASSSDCLRRLSQFSPGANSDSGFAVDESGNFSD